MKKNVMILSASPRRNGNSDTLANMFFQGAIDAGNNAEKIYVPEKNIEYCIGCMSCQNTNKCIHNDDMEAILNKMVKSDVIVFATPVYFYTMNAQLKTLIDRTVPRYTELSNKDYYIIMSAAEDNMEIMAHVLDGFEAFFDCIDNPKLKGVVYGLGLTDVQDVENHNSKTQAYEMGKSI